MMKTKPLYIEAEDLGYAVLYLAREGSTTGRTRCCYLNAERFQLDQYRYMIKRAYNLRDIFNRVFE